MANAAGIDLATLEELVPRLDRLDLLQYRTSAGRRYRICSKCSNGWGTEQQCCNNWLHWVWKFAVTFR